MTKKILIVEDNELSTKLFVDLLQSHGCNTLHSGDGMDTLELARKHRPDLIIMDIQLPEVSGLEHVKMLKADPDLKDIPVLAVTAFAMKGDKESILEVGCDGYLSKPISIPHFLAEVKKFLLMEPFRLTETLITGHPKVDADHEQLRVQLNEFFVYLEAGSDTGCAETIKEITKTVIRHFESEERIMEELGFLDCEFHKAEHQTTLIKYETLIKETELAGYGKNFANELTAVLVSDMIRTDMDFKVYLQDQNFRG